VAIALLTFEYTDNSLKDVQSDSDGLFLDKTKWILLRLIAVVLIVSI
jgi:hypothetical protein